MRPDVWARGRIEAMIRGAADPAARKPLEDRVRQEWEAVKGGEDLARLREFVEVFGPFFPVGGRGPASGWPSGSSGPTTRPTSARPRRTSPSCGPPPTTPG